MESKTLVLKDIAFTDALTDTLRETGSLMCRRYEGDPAVYVEDGRGYFLVKLDEREYDAFVRPVTHRDPGDFIMECRSPLLDLRKILEDLAFNASFELKAALTLEREAWDGNTMEVSTFYSEEGDFVSCLNARYALIVTSGMKFRAMDGLHAVVCYRHATSTFQDGTIRCVWDDPCAAIMPIRMREDALPVRETRAWFKQGCGQKAGCHE